MNGIIFCVCSTSAISVPPIVLKWCRKERQKMQVKKESQQNRSRWWIWSRDATQGILTCLPRLHQKARWKPDLKVKYLWVRGMSSNQERWDLWWALAHQTTQNGILTKSGLLKSGNLVKCWKQERRDPWWTPVHPAHRQVCHWWWWWWYGLWHCHRIEPFAKVTSFLHRVNDRVLKMQDQSSKMQCKTSTNVL